MLKDAKVTISLEDLDELRLIEKEYTQLLKKIANCVKFDFDKYLVEIKKIDNDEEINSLESDEEIDKAVNEALIEANSFAKVIIDTEKLEKILLSNCYIDKTENEIALFETLKNPTVIYKKNKQRS